MRYSMLQLRTRFSYEATKLLSFIRIVEKRITLVFHPDKDHEYIKRTSRRVDGRLAQGL
jgi:hypothetical protein